MAQVYRSQTWLSKRTDLHLYSLVFSQVNIVVFPSQGLTTQVLGPCKDRLYVATDDNKNDLVSDLQKLTADKSKQSRIDIA